jgi:hypothetical protein
MSEYKPIDECRTVEELLSDPARWNHDGGWAMDAIGLPTYYTDRQATCFCVDGAIRRIYGGGDDLAAENAWYKFVEVAGIDIAARGGEEVWEWNDAPERTHAEVLEAVKRAGI